jgi:hypothetical protein
MNARPSRGQFYDLIIGGLEDWDQLARRTLNVLVDPFVFRSGQFFLEGEEGGQDRWEAIASDLGALVSFFDLVVLNDQLPAFNYPDTFDRPDANLTHELRDRLGEVLNAEGDKTLVHVDVEHHMYRAAKEAALEQLGERMQEGPFMAPATAEEILASLRAVRYEWEPHLESLEPHLPGAEDQRLARFLLGQLVFSGYAQMTAAPHVLAPRRSLFLATVGLRTQLPTPHDRTAATEQAIYTELANRIRDAGDGWRDDELPWTPSFLPLLLERMKPGEGPDILLRRAKALRENKAVERYRELRSALTAEDAVRSEKARKDLAKAADKVADELRAGRERLEVTRHVVVEMLPKALGAAVGAGGGFLVAGPPGAIGGSVLGAVGEEPLRQVNKRLWGWTIDRLPFRSARKLLAQSVRAEAELKGEMAAKLQDVWKVARA